MLLTLVEQKAGVPLQASVALLQAQPGWAEQADKLEFSKHALAMPLQLGPVGSVQMQPGKAVHAADVAWRHEGSVVVTQVPSVDHAQPRSAAQVVEARLSLHGPPALPPRHVPAVVACRLQPGTPEQLVGQYMLVGVPAQCGSTPPSIAPPEPPVPPVFIGPTESTPPPSIVPPEPLVPPVLIGPAESTSPSAIVPPKPVAPPAFIVPPEPVVPPVAVAPPLPGAPPLTVPPPPLPELPAEPPTVPKTPPDTVPPVKRGASAGLAASGEDALVPLPQPPPPSGKAQPTIINRQAARRSFMT